MSVVAAAHDRRHENEAVTAGSAEGYGFLVEPSDLVARLAAIKPRLAVVCAMAVLTGLVAGFHVSVFPPKLVPRGYSDGMATTQMLVDSPATSLAEATSNVTATARRGITVAELARSPEVRALIAHRLGVAASSLEVQVQTDTSLPADVTAQQPNERRAGILDEGAPYRVLLRAQRDYQVIDIVARGPTAKGAASLANAVVRSLASVMRQIAANSQIPLQERVRVTPLGAARTGRINAFAPIGVAVAAGLAFLVFATALVLVVSGIAHPKRHP